MLGRLSGATSPPESEAHVARVPPTVAPESYEGTTVAEPLTVAPESYEGATVAMGKRRRTYKLSWRSKKANHGRKPCRGRDKAWK
jgi:hypothetical protein